MGVQVREKKVEEFKEKLAGMSTDLNKITYLESALKEAGQSFEIKRYLWGEMSRLYEGRKMFEKAAQAMSNKAGMDITFREKVDSYVVAADLYSKAGKVDLADEMFSRAVRDATIEQRNKIKLARKNIYSVSAKELERQGKKASAVKFYEKLIKMDISEDEKRDIKNKLKSSYTSLGLFREAKLLEGI